MEQSGISVSVFVEIQEHDLRGGCLFRRVCIVAIHSSRVEAAQSVSIRIDPVVSIAIVINVVSNKIQGAGVDAGVVVVAIDIGLKSVSVDIGGGFFLFASEEGQQ